MPDKNKDKYPSYRTPIGRLGYPFLQIPRDYEGDEKFAYSCDLILPEEQAAPLCQAIDGWLEESKAKFKTKKQSYIPYEDTVDENGDPVEGFVTFAFKVQAKTETRSGRIWDRKPAIFTLNGEKVEEKVGSGTQARVNFQVYLWKNPAGAGVTLQPKAVMVHELVEYVGFGGKAGDYFPDDDGQPAGDGADF